VLGSYVNRSGLAPVAAGVVDRLQIEPVTAGPAGGP